MEDPYAHAKPLAWFSRQLELATVRARTTVVDDLTLSRTASTSLRLHLETNRRAIATNAARASGGSNKSRSLGASLFVNAFLDRLIDELASGNREPLEAWAATAGAGAEAGAEYGALIVLACATIAASYAHEHPESQAVAKFLALRGRHLDDAIEAAARAAREGALPADALLVDRDDVITGLLASLESCDVATCEHSRAVGSWAGRVARSLRPNEEAARFVALCGTLHDVGKVATPSEVLLKPGSLDAREWEIMREHSGAGAAIIARIPSLRECAPIVRAHHERIDGRGYPAGLSGASIPLAARIVAVADSFHAMISNRPYRAALGAPRALATLMEGRGTVWDPIIVDAMIGLVQPHGTSLPRLRIVGADE